MSETHDLNVNRKLGKVVRLLPDYGFISSDEIPDQEIYFKTSWFQGATPLKEGDEVTFKLKSFGTNLQAFFVTRPDETGAMVAREANSVSCPLPTGPNLFDWGYLGHLPNILAELAGLALKEEWDFKNAIANAQRPLPILYSYLIHTFGRLVLEGKVLVNEDARLAAFNTGLVDPRYEPIHALFSRQNDPRCPWVLSGFCIAGEGMDGQKLVRYFNPLPSPAHYFDDPLDLLYDVRAGKPELDWKHIIIQRIDRYPTEFVEDHWPPGFEKRETKGLTDDERRDYFVALGEAIEHDKRTYRRIMNRVKDAIDLSLKRVMWNFKTAIPTYYPKVRKLQLLLPVCLVSDDAVDLALAVEKTPAGSYLGHTALPLDWAYKNARLICRPDSDWLAPKEISANFFEEEEEEIFLELD